MSFKYYIKEFIQIISHPILKSLILFIIYSLLAVNNDIPSLICLFIFISYLLYMTLQTYPIPLEYQRTFPKILDPILGPKRYFWKTLIFQSIGFMVMIICLFSIIYQQPFRFSNALWTLPTTRVIRTIIFAPIFEELLFRQYLYKWLSSKIDKIEAYLILLIIFVLGHNPHNAIEAIQYSLGASLFFYIYDKGKQDVRLSIIVHMINNIISLL